MRVAAAEVREAIVTEARTWIGTPWLHMARVKGCGTDCVQLLIAVYSTVGLIPALDVPPYPRGWDLRDDRYLSFLGPYVVPCATEPPQPGDLAVFRIGKYPAHAGIVTAWPAFVHADGISAECVTESAADRPELAKRYLYALTPRGLA